jgi:translocation and assembly module TamB
MRKFGMIAAWVVGGLVFLVLAAFALLQTGPAKRLLASTLNKSLAGPGSGVVIGTIDGVVPFDVSVSRIALTDKTGPWLTIDGARLRWSPSALLRGVASVDLLSAQTIDVLRLPAASPAQPSQTSAGFTLPRLPVGVELRQLEIARLIVAPALAGGDNAEASISGHGDLLQGRAAATLDLTRTGGVKGNGLIEARYDEAANTIGLKIDIDEPTGIAMDALTGRTDHLPLRVTLDGAGPLSGWAGRLHLASGDGIGADLSLQISHTTGTRVAVEGDAEFAALLAENARPMFGDKVTFSVTGAVDGKGGFMLAPSRIALAAVTLNVEGGASDAGALTGKMHIAVPDAAEVGALAGQATAGAISIDAALSGTLDRPRLAMSEQGALMFGQMAIDGLTLNADVASLSGDDAKDPRFDLTIDAKALDLRAAEPGGKDFGMLAVHLAGTTDTAGKLVDLRQLSARGGGVTVDGAGHFANGAADGKATVAAADLGVVGKLIGQPLGGSLTADVAAHTAADKSVTAQLRGTGDRLRTGIPAADALLAGPVKLAADLTVSPAGKIALPSASVESARASVTAAGGFDPADKAIQAKLAARLANLGVLSQAVSSPLAGSGTLDATIGGTTEAPTVDARAEIDRLAFQTVRIDHLDAHVVALQGLAGTARVDARIESGRLSETVAAAVSRQADQAIRLSDFRLGGTGGTLAGAAVIDLPRHAVSGKIEGTVGDLSVWSSVVGQPVAGRATLAATLPARGQGPLAVTLDRIRFGAQPQVVGIDHAALNGSISGDFARPAGTLDLALSGLAASGAAITQASAHVAAKAGAEDFRLSAAGRLNEAIAVEAAGTASQARGGNTIRLARLTASLGRNHVALDRPTTVTIAPGIYAVDALALDIDGGKLSGNAALSPRAVAADLSLRQLPLHPLAFLAGKQKVAGTLDGRVTLSGTARAPEAHLTLATTGLDLQTDGPLPRPKLSVSATGDWRGERAAFDVALASGSGEKLSATGSAPFAFDLTTFKPLTARDQSLAVQVNGGGRLENLTSIVPLGEDRITGGFSIAVAVGGTIAAPLPSGRIAITDGRYSNMALGIQLDGIDLAVNGEGERFVLDHLTANDGKSGTLNASGAVDLAAKPATVALNLAFADFLVARSDDATVDADGNLKVDGTLDGMKAAGTFTVRHAELYIPERLPSSVVQLNVIEVGGNRQAAAAEATKAKPLAPIALAIALDAPGQIFVRGHGLTSEWRSHIDVAGTSAAPSVTGQLDVVNGTLDLLGKTFTIDRGIVRFDGGAAIDPVLDVQASATTGSLTATVNVSGTASAPKIALSSIPVLPQDEILSQVLFGSDVTALTPSQGLQLAAAAASLAQGGPGVLDRLRNSIGLDVLSLGSASGSSGSSGSAQGTTVTGGKYIANGVLVGVQQGITSSSSAALVQVEITPHISVNSTFGTAAGSGFGAKYSIDY